MRRPHWPIASPEWQKPALKYIMQNEGGSQIVGEGQFGFVKHSKTVPEILAKDPNLNLKDLPFMLETGPLRAQDCVVK